MTTPSTLSQALGRSAIWISRIRKRFALPVVDDHSTSYLALLRKIRDLRNLGISEDKLVELWDLEKKLISILHLDLGGGVFSLIEGCSAEADPDRRLLLTNADLGVPLMASEVQAGLDFNKRPQELFEGKEMGEDALRLLVEYRNLLQVVREIVGREKGVLKSSHRWERSIGLGIKVA